MISLFSSECHIEFEVRCAMGLCIPSYLRCNGITECPDYSDESKCGNGLRKLDLHALKSRSKLRCNVILKCRLGLTKVLLSILQQKEP